MGELGQGIEGDVLGVVRVDVAFRDGTFLRELEGGLGDDGEALLPGDVDEEHLEEAVADLFEAGLLILELVHHELSEVDELIFIGAVAVEAVATSIGLVLLREGERESLDAENDVLHRIIREGLFGMFDVRIDDDEVIGFHGHLFALDIEDPLATEHIEELGELMGMREGVPVALIFRDGDVAKLEVRAAPCTRADADHFVTH